MTDTPIDLRRVRLAKVMLVQGMQQANEKHGQDLSAENMLLILQDVMETVEGLTSDELFAAASQLKAIMSVLPYGSNLKAVWARRKRNKT